MTTRYILHIGTHKTGTSSVQAFCAANRRVLLERGIDYPELGREAGNTPSHRHVSAWFRGIENEYPPGTGEMLARGMSDAPRCVLSSEDFYFIDSDEQVAATARCFGRSQVICVLREPVTHLMSFYKEALKGPLRLTLPEFVERHRRAMVMGKGFSYYSYGRNIERWRQHHDVKVLGYQNDGLVQMVLDAAGIALPSSQTELAPRENSSFSDSVAVIKLAINRLRALPGADPKALKRSTLRLYALAKAGRLPEPEAFCDRREADMAQFIAAFRKENPGYAGLAAQSPATLPYYEPQFGDAELVALLDEIPADDILPAAPRKRAQAPLHKPAAPAVAKTPARGPRILILGNSHTRMLADAVALLDGQGRLHVPVEVHWVKATPDAALGDVMPEDALAMCAALAPCDMLVLTLLGTAHNILGRIDHDIPFCAGAGGGQPVGPGRMMIPEALAKDWLAGVTARDFLIAPFIGVSKAPVVHLMPPPPKEVMPPGAKRRPKGGGEKGRSYDFTPAAVRLALWKLEAKVLADYLARHGVTAIGGIPAGTDANGFLRPEFAENDATHANAGYGVEAVRTLVDMLAALNAELRPGQEVTT